MCFVQQEGVVNIQQGRGGGVDGVTVCCVCVYMCQEGVVHVQLGEQGLRQNGGMYTWQQTEVACSDTGFPA